MRSGVFDPRGLNSSDLENGDRDTGVSELCKHLMQAGRCVKHVYVGTNATLEQTPGGVAFGRQKKSPRHHAYPIWQFALTNTFHLRKRLEYCKGTLLESWLRLLFQNMLPA